MGESKHLNLQELKTDQGFLFGRPSEELVDKPNDF